MNKLLIAACSLALNVTDDKKHLLLVPEGDLNGLDGRHWTLSVADGQALVVALNSQKIDMVIDYEHATLRAKEKGTEAPAAGWCKAGQFEYVAGLGVCSNGWSWTPPAQSRIENDEYRYLSPVFLYTKDGAVKTLLHAALTNTPNLDVLPEVLLAAASRQLLTQESTTEEGGNVDELLERLRWTLNLPISATPEEILSELGKLQDQISTATGVTVAANSKNLFDAVAGIPLLVAANSQQVPDPSKFVPISMFNASQAQVAELTQAAAEVDLVEPLIQAALSDGRLLETNTEHLQWARDYGKQDPEGLKRHLEAAPRIAALSQRQTKQTNIAANSQQHGSQSKIDAETTDLAKTLGVSLADIEKYGA